jgi:AcrR family transcriptional regulator
MAKDPTEPDQGAERGEDERAAMLAAMLSVSGELGFRRTTAARVAGRVGGSAGRFYAHFATREECFAAAYEQQADALLPRLLAGVEEDRGGCRERVDAVLVTLFDFVTAEEAIARGLMAEVYVAGGAALARHEEVLERLSRVVADACRETDPSRHDPPPTAARFIVGGLEESVRRRLAERRAALLWDDLPVLTTLALAALGD